MTSQIIQSTKDSFFESPFCNNLQVPLFLLCIVFFSLHSAFRNYKKITKPTAAARYMFRLNSRVNVGSPTNSLSNNNTKLRP